MNQNYDNKLGIDYINEFYIETNYNQNVKQEYEKICEFLKKFVSYYAKKHMLNEKDIHLRFINYGKTELVYVLTEKSGYRVTVLVKQPAVKLGKVKEEAKNLIELKKIDKKVVAPVDYFSVDDQELYVTPYINQARCVASSVNWGMYVPEPCYRFVTFSKKQEQIVNTCMIAKLISYYNPQTQEGICACKLGGGDFMLTKGWETQKPTYKNTMENLYFIACRKKIKCSLKQYIAVIKDEFCRKTIYEDQNSLIINHRGRVAMNPRDVKNGIKLGLTLLKEHEKSLEQ